MRTTLSIALLFALTVPTPAFAGNMFADTDGDGYGDDTTVQVAPATLPTGFVADSGDCNDGDADINPGEADIPWDGIDQNCDGKDARRMPTARESKAFGKTSKSALEHLGRELARCEASAHCSVVYTTPPACTGTCQETAEFSMSSGYFFVDLVGDGVVGRVVVNEDDKADDSRLRAYRGSGGVSKKTMDAAVEASATTLRGEMAAEFARDRARLDHLDTRVSGLEGSVDQLRQRSMELSDRQDGLEGGLLALSGYEDDAGEYHTGMIEEINAREVAARVNVDQHLQMTKADNWDGLTLMAQVGGFGGLQKPYIDPVSEVSLRGTGVAGVGAGGLIGGYFGDLRLGGEVSLFKNSDGGSWVSGLEGVYFFNDVIGAGLFLGGGTHETGGTPPVESEVVGRYGMIGLEFVAAAPFYGYGAGEAVLRLYGGPESFGTRYEIENGEGADAQMGMILGAELMFRGGTGPKGR